MALGMCPTAGIAEEVPMEPEGEPVVEVKTKGNESGPWQRPAKPHIVQRIELYYFSAYGYWPNDGDDRDEYELTPELTWPGKHPLRSVTWCPSQLRESYGSATDGWMHKLYHGDNL